MNTLTASPGVNQQLMSNCFTSEFRNSNGPGGSWGEVLTLSHNVNLDHFIIIDKLLIFMIISSVF